MVLVRVRCVAGVPPLKTGLAAGSSTGVSLNRLRVLMTEGSCILAVALTSQLPTVGLPATEPAPGKLAERHRVAVGGSGGGGSSGDSRSFSSTEDDSDAQSSILFTTTRFWLLDRSGPRELLTGPTGPEMLGRGAALRLAALLKSFEDRGRPGEGM